MIRGSYKKVERGFSLIELLVVMSILVFVFAILTSNFIILLRAMKIEAKSAETEVEKIIGLEILRQDIENAGYGLPWFVDIGDWSTFVDYREAMSGNNCGTNIVNYNDAPNNPPRGILSGNNVCTDGSDYLVIKSTVVHNNMESQKWTYIWNEGTSIRVNSWYDTNTNLSNQTQVIAISPRQFKRENVLVTYVRDGVRRYFAQYSNATDFQPKPSEVFLLFGLGDDNTLGMPFNRADYYISRDNVPQRCANGTGVLIKATLSHINGMSTAFYPLLDCVADMQVVFGVDITGVPDGRIDCYTNDFSNLSIQSAEDIRNRVKEVRIYILSHEGQLDRDFTFGNNTIRVGDLSNLPICNVDVETVLGRDYDLNNISDFQNYRWKVFTLSVPPEHLRGR